MINKMEGINRRRLFNAASLSLVVTAMTFAVRANLMGPMGAEFELSPTQMGQVASAAFWGFTLAMLLGGAVCDIIGIRSMFIIAFLGHILGIVFTIFSVGFWSLFLSTLLIGLGNGFIESASYTMVSSLYTEQKSKRINDWHIWFPCGIVIGGVVAYLFSLNGLGWKWQMMIMIPPTLLYGYLFLGQQFPQSERISMGVTNREMIKECFRPLFIFMVCCMFLTGATELGTNQWIAELLSAVGVPSILLLVFINGIMAVGRYNAGAILKRISNTGLLFLSAVFSFIGLLWLSYAAGYSAFAAAAIFAVGICFFWPTMIGFVSENLPKSGPLGLSLMGAVGLLSTALIMPYYGQVYESQLSQIIPEGFDQDFLQRAVAGSKEALIWGQAKLHAGAATLRYVSIMPATLILAFGVLHFSKRKKSQKQPLETR